MTKDIIIGGSNSINIQSMKDIFLNLYINDDVIKSILEDKFEELFNKLSASDDKLKNEIVKLIKSNKNEQASIILDELIKNVSRKFSDDCLDIANLSMILKPKQAKEFYEKSIEIEPNNYTAINCYAIYLMGCGQLDSAESLFSSAFLNCSLSNIQKEAIAGNLGVLYKNRAQWDKAIKYLNLAIRIAKLNQSYIGSVKHLNNLGSVFVNFEKNDTSKVYLDESMSKLNIMINIESNLDLKNEYKVIKTNILTNMSIRLRYLFLRSNDESFLNKAVDLLNQAIDISEILDKKLELSRHYGNLSNVYRDLKNKKECKKLILKSLTIAKEIGDHRGEVCGLLNLGLAHFDNREFYDAKERLEEGILKENNMYPKLKAHLLCNLAFVYKELKDNEKMWSHAREAKDLYQKLGLSERLQVVNQNFIGV